MALQAISVGGNLVSQMRSRYRVVGIEVVNAVGDSVASATLSQALAITGNTVRYVISDIGIPIVNAAVGVYVGNVAGLTQVALAAGVTRFPMQAKHQVG